MNITNLNAEYTGGGIYIITGNIDGEWFLATSDEKYIDIVDGDYHAIEWDGGEDVDWYNNHYLRTPKEGKKREMLKAIFNEIDDSRLRESLERNWF